MVCEGGLVGRELRPLLFAPRVLFILVNSLHLSCVHLVWSQAISLLQHNSYTLFGRLVHPVLPVLLCPLSVPTDVSVLFEDAWLWSSHISSGPDQSSLRHFLRMG